MFSFLKQKNKSQFNILTSLFLLKKRRRVLFICLILLFFVSLHCLAKTTYSTTEINILKDTYGLSSSQITNLQNNDVNYNDFKTNVDNWVKKGWTTSDAVNYFYKDSISTSTGVDLITGVKGLDNEIGASAQRIFGKFVLAPILAALWVIGTFCWFFVKFSAQVLDLTLTPSLYNFTGNAMISTGWTTVRDVCNLFFLLILLFIAFCTILQIEKYHARKTLLTLIIMALLINFSKPIAIFIFDGSQLLMTFFLNKISSGGQNASIMVSKASEIADIVWKTIPSVFEHESTGLDIALSYIFAIVFLFMYAVALVVMAIFLVIRIVAIMLLIVVSPVAFLATAIPDFKKLSSGWWDALFRYSYFGPAAAFFIWLSTKFAGSLPSLTKDATGSTLETLILKIINYLAVVVLIYASIIMANKFGIQFAQAITSRADKIMKYGTGLAAVQWTGRKAWQGTKYAGRAGARLADYKILAPLGISPRALWRGWKKGSEEAEREAMEPAEAKARDRFNKLLGRRKPPTYHENVQFETDVDKYMKEQRNISTEDKALIAVIEKFKNDKSPEAQKRVAAALRLMFENNDQNEFMKQYALINKDFKDLNLKSNNPEDLRKALQFVLGRSGMRDEDQIGRQLHQLGTIALGKGNFGNFGMASFNATEGKYEINDGRDEAHRQLSFSRAKARNIDVQEKMKRMHWNAILEEKENGDTGRLHQTGMVLLADMKQAEIAQLNRARPDFIERVYGARQQIQDFAKSGWIDPRTGKGLDAEQVRNLENFVKGIERQYRGEEKVSKSDADEQKLKDLYGW